MAVTGIFFVLFLLLHMYGNLKIFMGPEAYNGYAEWMREMGYPVLPHKGGLWILRVLLLLSIVGHMYSAIALWRRANVARGRSYKVNSGSKKTAMHSYTARTMRWGGVVIAVFIVFHLLQYTVLAISVGADDYSAMTPYERMMAGFDGSVWYMYVFYLISILLVAFHVRHGVWSALATLGVSNRHRETLYQRIGDLVALLLIVGFMAPPTAILLGWVS